MRQRLWVLLGLWLLLLSVVSVNAQGRTIVSIVNSNPDLSTMAAFIEATRPDFRERLGQSGSFTLFAPTNQAFANLASTLDITLQELLANGDIVTQIVQYHTILGVQNERQLRALDGQIIPSTLRGAFVQIRLSDDGSISLNNVVSIQRTDIGASNGLFTSLMMSCSTA